MKRFLSLILTLFISIATFAQLNGNGFYRVKNNATGNYIWVCDNTGEINTTTTSADMGAIQLWNGLDKAIPEPESVLYFENKGGNYWNISAMGTSIYDLVEHYVELNGVTNNGVTLYEVSATQSGATLYLYDGGEGPADYNVLATSGKDQTKRKWLIEPITTNGNNYFGIKPTINVGSKYYEPFYASFPFSFASSGMKAYYISKIDGNIAVLKEIKNEIIPAKTPVIVECSSSNPANNRVNLLTSGGVAITDNVLSGNVFCNEFRTSSPDASTVFNANTMRVFNVGSNGKLTLNTSTSLLHKDYYGSVKTYLNATSSYLSVAAGTPAELTIMTEEEYNNTHSYTRGDANGDGQVGMPDIMFIVNHILGTPAEGFNQQGADANGDGQIGMPDVMYVVQFILTGEFPSGSAKPMIIENTSDETSTNEE